MPKDIHKIRFNYRFRSYCYWSSWIWLWSQSARSFVKKELRLSWSTLNLLLLWPIPQWPIIFIWNRWQNQSLKFKSTSSNWCCFTNYGWTNGFECLEADEKEFGLILM
jgi:hypothetical protein